MKTETKIKSIALQTLQIETEAIEALKDSINDDFVACVKVIFASNGRLIVTGIGKSAIIAQKMVATFNSTGTAAIFMHAADAIHGDLGMIQPADLVLCVSKSGDTPEIKVLLPLLKNLNIPIFGIVANKNSYLAQHAEYVLWTPIDKEADPNNLAPTASTTAQMALGDAMATALLALRGFSPKDFAQFHPGGALGKQLYLRVRDIYTQNEKPVVQLNSTIRETIMEMTSKRLGVTVVVNNLNEIEGIITDGDLRRMLENETSIEQLTAADIMAKNPKTIEENELAVNALEALRENSITQIIVVSGKTYLGIVHLHDLIREGLI